jgi:hypothetical protein
MARKPHETVMVRIRMPEALRLKLVAEGEANNRSFNAEALFRLTATLTDEWKEFVKQVELREQAEQEMLERLRQDPEFQAKTKHIIERLKQKERKR